MDTVKPTRTFGFRLPEDLVQALDEAAAKDLRSRNAQIVHYIRLGLKSERRR